MECKQCNQEFEGRAGAKYCSAKCRKSASREAKCDISVTEEPILVTDNTEELVTDVCATMPDVEGEFEDLPPDVQRAIEYMSQARSKLLGIDYEDEKAIRTARALKYLQLFPDRYYSRGAA